VNKDAIAITKEKSKATPVAFDLDRKTVIFCS
jgi:hypothetical protein